MSPDVDETHEIKHTLQIDWDRMKYENFGPHWLPSEERFVSRSYVSAYEGGESNKAFFGKSEETIHPIGFISTGKRSQDWDNDHLAPLLMTYRPFHPLIGRFKPAEWKLGSETVMSGENRCRVLERTDGEMIYRCWVDPQREFLISRFLQYLSGSLIFQIDICYQEDRDALWFPCTWTSMVMNHKTTSVRQSTSAKVTEHKVNLSLPIASFAFDFPPGTEVVDMTNRENREHFIVRTDGSRRRITDEEQGRNASYSDLLSSDEGAARLPEATSGVLLRWTLGGLMICLVLIVVRRWFSTRLQRHRAH